MILAYPLLPGRLVDDPLVVPLGEWLAVPHRRGGKLVPRSQGRPVNARQEIRLGVVGVTLHVGVQPRRGLGIRCGLLVVDLLEELAMVLLVALGPAVALVPVVLGLVRAEDLLLPGELALLRHEVVVVARLALVLEELGQQGFLLDYLYPARPRERRSWG